MRTDATPKTKSSATYCYEGGLSSFVDYLTVSRGQTPLHETPIHFSAMHGDRSAEIAMQYTDSYNETMLSFANNVRTVDGGTHETGFKTALTAFSTTTDASIPFSRTATRSSPVTTCARD